MASRADVGFCSFLCFLLLAIGIAPPAQAKDWPPISAEELAMKEYPPSLGAPAIILYREVYIIDERSMATEYYRIKILKEEGKKYADVIIPFAGVRVEGIQGRTVHPDGSVVNFDGQVFEKPIAKTRRRKILVKTFALPEVKVGSIIEYKYRILWKRISLSLYGLDFGMGGIRGTLGRGYSLSTQPWRVQQHLFTRRARFSFQPLSVPLGWTWLGLPTSKSPSYQADGTIQLELENIPAFEEEEYMPPESFLKSRVAFFYVSRKASQPESFWSGQGKLRAKEIEKFIGKRKGIRRAVAEIITPDDPPETKLRKLYARVQQIRDLRNDRSMSDKDKQEAYKKNKNVEDVLKSGYGHFAQINGLFAALARAAGFDTYVVQIAGRDESIFNPNLPDWNQLDHQVVMVRSGSKDLYLDPSNPYCPFGFLSWEAAGVQGVLLQKSGGVLVKTPEPESANTVTERKAELQLSPDGTLKGQVHVSFTGQEALKRRLEALEKDDAGRRKGLEEEIKEWFPKAADVKLTMVRGWEEPEEPLRAEFTLEVRNLAVSAGRRLLLPQGIFQTSKKHRFKQSKRIHPVYFKYPYQEADEVTVQLPTGYRVEGMPAPRKNDTILFGSYEISCENQAGILRLKRRLVVDSMFFPLEYYSALRTAFAMVTAGDEQQVVLQTAAISQRK